MIKIIIELFFKIFKFLYGAKLHHPTLDILSITLVNEITFFKSANFYNKDIFYISLSEFLESQSKEMDILDKRLSDKIQNTYERHKSDLYELNKQMLDNSKAKSADEQKLLMEKITAKKMNMLKTMSQEYIEQLTTHKVWLKKLLDFQKQDLVLFLQKKAEAEAELLKAESKKNQKIKRTKKKK